MQCARVSELIARIEGRQLACKRWMRSDRVLLVHLLCSKSPTTIAISSKMRHAYREIHGARLIERVSSSKQWIDPARKIPCIYSPPSTLLLLL